MMIIGCDLHTRYQQIAMVDIETGEFVQRSRSSEHEAEAVVWAMRHGVIESVVVVLFTVGFYVGLPVLMIWGWVRWSTRTQTRTPVLRPVPDRFHTRHDCPPSWRFPQ